MSKYKIYEVVEKEMRNGGTLKKLILQGEGKQYPEKNVTMFSDHPLFPTIAAGQEIDVELDIKDSTSPNPHGGFYKDKVVLKPGAMPTIQIAPQAAENARGSNVIDFKLIPIVTRLEAALDRLERVTGFVAGEIDKEDDVIIPFSDDDAMSKNSPF